MSHIVTSEQFIAPNFHSQDPMGSIEERRRRKLERLNARHGQLGVSCTTSQTARLSAAAEEANFDQIQSRANSLLDDRDAVVEPSFLVELESALALLPAGLQSRRLKDAYNELRGRLQKQRSEVHTKSSFSFSSKQTEAPGLHLSAQEPVKKQYQSTTSDNDSKISMTIAGRSKDSIVVNNKMNEKIRIEGDNGKDVMIVDVSNCQIAIPLSASAVHLKNVCDSIVVMSPVGSSVMLRNCERLTLIAAAQQIRIHCSRDLRLHVAARGAVIIEDCDNVEVAPYKVKNVSLDWSNDNWREVKDFNWLVTQEQSPHWNVMPEERWTEFDL